MPKGAVNLTDPVNRAHPLNRGLVSWWLGLPQWCGGLTWFDLMRVGDGVATSQVSVVPASRPGGWACLRTTSKTDYVRVPSSRYVTAGSKTWCAWVRTSYTTAGQWVLIYNGASYETALAIGNMGPVGAAGKPTFVVYTTTYYAATGATTVTDGTGSLDGSWHHLAGVYDAAAATVKIYTDGVLDGSGSVTGSQGVETDYLFMGIVSNGTAAGGLNGFSGSLDDVRVYSRSLSDGEVSALYRESLAGYPGCLRRVRAAAPKAAAAFRPWLAAGRSLLGNGVA